MHFLYQDCYKYTFVNNAFAKAVVKNINTITVLPSIVKVHTGEMVIFFIQLLFAALTKLRVFFGFSLLELIACKLKIS